MLPPMIGTLADLKDYEKTAVEAYGRACARAGRDAALQHPAAPSVSPAYDRELIARMLEEVIGGPYSRAAVEEQIRLLRDADNTEAASIRTVNRSPSVAGDAGELRRLADEMERQWHDARAPWLHFGDIGMIRRLATAEQPGSAVQGEAVRELLIDCWLAINSIPEQSAAKITMLQRLDIALGKCLDCAWNAGLCETHATPPPAPAAEQGDAVTKALDTLTQYSAEHGHPADFERAITTLSVLAKSTATQPEARGVEGMVPRSDLADLYRAYVRLLEAGRDRIMDLGGTCDPVDMMERSDPFLIRARRALAAAPSGVRVDG
jgi:hypothetical protein